MGGAGDSITYHNIADNLYHGRGYSAIAGPGGYGYRKEETGVNYKPAMTRSPVYPFFLYLIYKSSGNEHAVTSLEQWSPTWDKVRVVQSVIDTLSCLLVFLIVRQLFSSSFYPALLGALLYASCSSGIYYSIGLSHTLSLKVA